MKKLVVLVLLTYLTSCANPEDHATGNADSTSYNKGGNENNLNNSNDDPEAQSGGNMSDTGSYPSTKKENVNSSTQGTNRTYKAGGDSSKNKQ